MSDIARQRARQLAGELANILTNEIFGDYGTDWTWDELCKFITNLKTLAQARGAPVGIDDNLNRERFKKGEAELSDEMREHLEMYHPAPSRKLLECQGCGKFFKIIHPRANVCQECYFNLAGRMTT